MGPSTSTQPAAWPPRRVAFATLVVLVIAGAFFLLIQFRLVFFSLFTAIVLSSAFTPLVKSLERRKIPRTVSTIFISLIGLALLIAFILVVAPLIIQQWATLTSLLSDWYREGHRLLLQSSSLLIRRIARQLPMQLPLALSAPQPNAAPGQNSLQLVQQAVNFSEIALRNLLTIASVGLLTGIWMLEGDRSTRILLLAVPQNKRDSIRAFVVEAEKKVGAYTRGLVWLSSIVGGMATVAYLIIGLPNILLLGILAGIMEIVPLIGPMLGALPAFLVAASTDPSKIVWVVVSTAVIQLAENNLIVPRVMDRAVGVNPVASLLAFLAFGTIFGFVGALLAVPLAAVIQITLSHFVFQRPAEMNISSNNRDAVSMLRYEAQDLVQDVRKKVREKDEELEAGTDQIEDSMEAIIQDLNSILVQIEEQKNSRKGDAQA